MPLIVTWMVYAKVVLRVQNDYKAIPRNRASNVFLYQLDRFVRANSLAFLKTHSPPIIVLLVL